MGFEHRVVLAVVSILSVASGSALAGQRSAPPPPESKYVAMGSSFAAGSGIGKVAENSPYRCGRSSENYAHLVAAARHLKLVDVTCGGATTEHILGPWNELAPQIEAVDADTRLVTLTIGGNDLNYIGSLTGFSCRHASLDASSRAFLRECPASAPPTEQAYAALRARLERVAAEVRRRAPAARLVILQYPVMLPPSGDCPSAPVGRAEGKQIREVGERLAKVTEDAARAGGFEVLAVDRLSRGHDACSASPWVNGFTTPFRGDGVFYHPNRAGMIGQAQALERLVWGSVETRR